MKQYIVLANGKLHGEFDNVGDADAHAVQTAVTWKVETGVYVLISPTKSGTAICKDCKGLGDKHGVENGIEGYHRCFDCNGTGVTK